MHTTAHTHLSFFHLVNWYCSVFHSLTRRTTQNRTIYRADSGWDKGFWCGRLDEDNAHIIVSENGREIARTVRRLPLSQRVDVSLLKRVKGLPWDGQVWSDVVDLRSWCYLNPRWQRLEKHFERTDHLRVERDVLRFDLDGQSGRL